MKDETLEEIGVCIGCDKFLRVGEVVTPWDDEIGHYDCDNPFSLKRQPELDADPDTPAPMVLLGNPSRYVPLDRIEQALTTPAQDAAIREALEPFAKACDYINVEADDAELVEGDDFPFLQVGHFRRASQALAQSAGEGLRTGGEDFQARVGGWMQECFGPKISADLLERRDRLVEEALELAQTLPAFSAERAHALVDYVFSRPVGLTEQEVGGVSVTLAALCQAEGISQQHWAEVELARILRPEIVEKIRAKQASKPTGSALPEAPASKEGEWG